MAAEDKMPQKSPFAKLFSSDAQADKQLQKIRDGIYSFAWSRDRRDEAKMDWVLSENGVNRNVHMRWMGEASSGSNRDYIDTLPCWLLLVNKRISADFTRFIYSVNDLDILVDLKANDTESNKAKLDKIANLLQNKNLKLYTRSARVRIHFPDKYPSQNLPLFNQHALENIALALDRFQLLSSLSVRVVPMQGPEVYELRLAAFPFYPMSMINWSIRVLNSRTFNWEIVAGEQLHHLNLAWDLFQETGSLTATVHAPGDAEEPPNNTTRAPVAKGADDVPSSSVAARKKNGSQKRKGRKLKALSTAIAPSASESTSMVPSADLPLRSNPPSLDLAQGSQSISVSVHDPGSRVEPSPTKSSFTQLPIQSAGKLPNTGPPACDAAGTAHQSSSPGSTNKLEARYIVKHDPASEASEEAVEVENTAEQYPRPASSIDTAPEASVNQQEPQEASPSSSAPSSVTLGRDQGDDEIEIPDTVEEPPQAGTVMKEAGANNEKTAQKKRRNRKKGKKTQLTDTAGKQSNDDNGQQKPAEAQENRRAFLISGNDAHEITTSKPWEGLFVNGQRPFPLSEIVDLKPWPMCEDYLQYERTNGNCGVLSRGSDLDRLLRQKERKAALEIEKQAEKMRAKGRKNAKKVKEVMIRRKEPSDDLRRRLEDTKQLAAGKQGSDLRKRFSEITGDGLDKAVLAPQVNSTEDFDSSDSFPEDTPSSPEQSTYSQWGSPVRTDDLDKSTVSHHRQPSSSSHSTVAKFPRSTQVLKIPHDLETGEEDSQVEHRHRQVDEQRLAKEVEDDSDDRASIDSQYGDERPPLTCDGEDQSPAA